MSTHNPIFHSGVNKSPYKPNTLFPAPFASQRVYETQ